MTLLVCRTCPRYDLGRTGQFGRELAAAIVTGGRDVAVRKVQCLGGCPDDGVAAVDGPGLTRIRFCYLTPAHAGALVTAALAHQGSVTGDLSDWEVPAELSGRISAVTTKRRPGETPSSPAAYPPVPHRPRLARTPWGSPAFGRPGS